MLSQPGFESFAEAAIGWIATDSAGTRWSDGVYGLLGLDPGEFAPSLDLFLSYVHPRDRGETVRVLSGAHTGTPGFRVTRRTGEIRLVTATLLDLDPGSGERRLLLFDLTRTLEWPGTPGGRAGPTGRQRLAPGLWCRIGGDERLTVSPEVASILGLPSEDRIAVSTLLALTSADGRDDVAQALAGRGPETSLRFRCVRADAPDTRHLELTVSRFGGQAGEVLGLAGTLVDVTQEVCREVEVAGLRLMLASLASRVRDGLMLLDRDGRVVQSNPQALRLLGLGPTENLLATAPGLAADPIGRFVKDEHPPGCRDERWVPALSRWLAYSLDRVGGHTLFLVRDDEQVLRLEGLVGRESRRLAAALDAAGAALIEIDPGADRVRLSGPGDAGPIVPVAQTWSDLKTSLADPDRAILEGALDATLRDAEHGGEALCASLRLGEETVSRRLRGAWRRDGVGGSVRFVGLLTWSGPQTAAPAAANEQGRALSGVQVRAARGALRWSVRELAERSDVSVATINRFEADLGPVRARGGNVAALERALAQSGIRFFESAGRPAIAIGPVAEDGPARASEQDFQSAASRTASSTAP